ncbi:MAG: patatin-like phospholipase family protein [Rhodospirillales bacterium]|nr:patatin-like phospholipase family protein [Rhodospirillales bacterium]
MPAAQTPKRPVSYDKQVALVLQGGGALGSYQAGAYEALAQSEYVPDWVAGVSIGGINAAIIAGNPPPERVGRLRDFWETVTASSSEWPMIPGAFFDEMHRRAAALSALLLGQPGFFKPWDPLEWFSGDMPASYYDTSALRRTLERLIDFDRINARETRLSISAVNVETCELVHFDNVEMTIRPEHVLASTALPPGFPAVEIDGARYWDGGLVSNTPLQYVLSYYPRRSRLTFQIDLFPSSGTSPRTIEDVWERAKDIRYSSRTRAGTDHLRAMHDIRHNLNLLFESLPDSLKTSPAAAFLSEIACVTTMDIAQVIYRPENMQGPAKDYEFSRLSMQRRWPQGMADAQALLDLSPWLEPSPATTGVRVFEMNPAPAATGAAHSR